MERVDILSNEKPLESKEIMPFEFFYLGELLAEGIINQSLFDKAYEKLSKELKLNKEKEMEL